MGKMMYKERGLTVIEVVIGIGITLTIITVLVRFLVLGNPISKITFLQARSTETARIQLKRISKAIREARESDTGGYPLVDMSPQRIIFYSDIDADDTTERVRYELVGTSLERGVTEPSGVPAVYNPATEVASMVATHVVNGATDIFTYYSGDYPADTTPLTPVDLTEVKYIEFFLQIDANPNEDPPPIEVTSQVQIRNLKTNLAETVP